jgi:hypothetical protein
MTLYWHFVINPIIPTTKSNESGKMSVGFDGNANAFAGCRAGCENGMRANNQSVPPTGNQIRPN